MPAALSTSSNESAVVADLDIDFMGLRSPFGAFILISIFVVVVAAVITVVYFVVNKGAETTQKTREESYDHEMTKIERTKRAVARLTHGKEGRMMKEDPGQPQLYRPTVRTSFGVYQNEVDWQTLNAEAKKMLAMKFEDQGKKFVESFHAQFLEHEATDDENAPDEQQAWQRRQNRFTTDFIQNARHPTIRMWTRYQARAWSETDIHQNHILNWRLQVLIGQAPMPHEFHYYITKTWGFEVAVIVSVGENGQKTMVDPFISLEEGGVTEFNVTSQSKFYGLDGCDKFELKTMMITDDQERGYLWYMILFTCVDGNGRRMTRMIDLVHIYKWPDRNVPAKPTQLAEIVLHVNRLRAKRRTRKWHPEKIDTGDIPVVDDEKAWLRRDLCVAVHCDDGQYRSPAFAAMLIANNRAVRQGKVGVMEILGRIRRNRYHAFLGDARKAFSQFQLVFAVSALLLEKAAKPLGKLKPKVSTAELVEQALSNLSAKDAASTKRKKRRHET